MGNILYNKIARFHPTNKFAGLPARFDKYEYLNDLTVKQIESRKFLAELEG